MTRFARAKGSKSCNEKIPEDSTPWEIMKEQLIDSKKQSIEIEKRNQAEKQRIVNYENFLKEQKTKKRKASWCSFPETEKKPKSSGNSENTSLNKSSNMRYNENATPNNLKKKISKRNKNKKEKSEQSNDGIQSQESKDEDPPSVNAFSDVNNKKKKKKRKNLKNIKEEDTEIVRRRKPSERFFKIIINGKEVDLVRFDGFPIMKKDAERLEQLKESMNKNGIPKSEIQRTLKLERRRAEKALSRLKKEVCYNCRKGGHNLSDCPEIKSKIPGADVAEGICFKCGSTEHKQFECKVQNDKGYRFATCFICKEQGHIARQCPDNPRGLYPNGGCCKLCGDVTHLKKDCPSVKEHKEESKFKLQTLNCVENVEEIDSLPISEPKKSMTKKKNKKVFF